MMTGLMLTLATYTPWAGVRRQDILWRPLSVSVCNGVCSILYGVGVHSCCLGVHTAVSGEKKSVAECVMTQLITVNET